MMQHGAFGVLYPLRSYKVGELAYIEGGGTVLWLCLVNSGLSDINSPWWGGWSGRSTREKLILDAAGKEIHIILEVKDMNELGSLWDYRRVVLYAKS